MATTTIKSSLGDYTTIALWEADTDNDLTGAGAVIGEIYDVNPTAALTIAGATNGDASNYRGLTVNSAYRHAGVWNTGKMNWQVATLPLTVDESFTRLSYLQVHNSDATNGNGVIRLNNPNCLVDSCICWHAEPGNLGTHSGVYSAGSGTTIRNTVCYNNNHGVYLTAAATGSSIENSTLVANVANGLRTETGAAPAVKNTYMGGNAGGDCNRGGSSDVDWTIITSMASDALSTESGLTNSIAWSTANFTNVTAGSIDVHLVTGSALIGAGTDLSSDFTVDFEGDTRSSWDVGPDEFASGGTTADLAATEDEDQAAATGTLTIAAAATVTEDNDQSAAAAALAIAANAALIEEDDALAAAASLGGTTADLAATEDDDQVSGTAALAIAAAGAATEDDDQASSSATLAIAANAALIEEDDALAASADLEGTVTGDLAVTEDEDQASGTATLAISAAANITEADDQASGAASFGITASAAIGEDDDQAAGVASFGITADAAATEDDDSLAAAMGALSPGIVRSANAGRALAAAAARRTLTSSTAARTLTKSDGPT